MGKIAGGILLAVAILLFFVDPRAGIVLGIIALVIGSC